MIIFHLSLVRGSGSLFDLWVCNAFVHVLVANAAPRCNLVRSALFQFRLPIPSPKTLGQADAASPRTLGQADADKNNDTKQDR